MAGLTLSNIQKTYENGFEAIQGIDMEIEDGALIVLVGPSGCGKSTLLRMVAGLETITGGELTIGGRVVNQLEPKDRDIAMVFQNYALYPHMSVRQNMSYGLKIRRMSRSEIDERVERAAKMLELSHLLDRKPRQLSGGQRQRVAMGRAIVREPAVFLFDEPLSNLDAKLRVQMRLEIKRLQRELGTTAIYVTHDQVEAMTLADRLMVMNAGVAEQIGTPLEVYERPATTFVAGFIGSPAMNFLPAIVTSGGNSLDLADGGRLGLSNGGLGDRDGQHILLGVRPEDLTPATEPGSAALQATAEMVEPLGADTLVHARFQDHLITARLPGHVSLAEGTALSLAPDTKKLHFFDADTGARIAA